MEPPEKKPFFTTERNADDIAAGYMTVDEHTYGKVKVHHWKGRENGILRIGKFCSIAAGVEVFLGGNHRPDWIAMYPFNTLRGKWPKAKNIGGQPTTKGDVVIGNDVWLGAGCTIMSGVTIGDGAVVAARSVVTKDVPPFAIVGGNPSKVLKMRFGREIVDELMKIQWWNWPVEQVAEYADILASNKMEAFLEVNRTMHIRSTSESDEKTGFNNDGL
jgi:acetyltransferase-like isoleucine patch superfamily enzyme